MTVYIIWFFAQNHKKRADLIMCLNSFNHFFFKVGLVVRPFPKRIQVGWAELEFDVRYIEYRPQSFWSSQRKVEERDMGWRWHSGVWRCLACRSVIRRHMSSWRQIRHAQVRTANQKCRLGLGGTQEFESKGCLSTSRSFLDACSLCYWETVSSPHVGLWSPLFFGITLPGRKAPPCPLCSPQDHSPSLSCTLAE